MRKMTLMLFLILLLFSCKKQESKNENFISSANNELQIKINSWLDAQKSKTQPNKAANIELLKNNLDLSELVIESAKLNDKLYIIPVKADFKIIKKIPKNFTVKLILIVKPTGEISNGNLVLYAPESDKEQTVPANTFHDILNSSKVKCDGQFRFLSVSGTLLYKLTYKDQKLLSAGVVESRVPARSEISARENSSCIDWYLITTYYFEDGTTYTTTEYVGRTCSACDNPDIQSDCPDDIGGSGGDGNSCYNAEMDNFNQEHSGSQVVSEPISMNISNIDQVTKHKDPLWKIFNGAGGWQLNSQEVGVIKLVDLQNNKWEWVSLTHGGISMTGSTLPGVAVSYTQGIGTSTISSLYAGMSLNFNVTYNFVCNCPNFPLVGWIPAVNKAYTANAIWNSNPF